MNRNNIKYLQPKHWPRVYSYLVGRLRAKAAGLKFVPPNYAFFEQFQPGDISVDIGIGDDPDFSKYLIANYGMESFGVDPTRKHMPALRSLEDTTPAFHYLPYALGTNNEQTTFYESNVDVSGSILSSHINFQKYPYVSYPVQVVTLDRLLKIVDKNLIAILKIDIEGYEYDLIDNLERETFDSISQVIIEFHHDAAVKNYTLEDTHRAIKKIESFGMKSLDYNGRDCLFYR